MMADARTTGMGAMRLKALLAGAGALALAACVGAPKPGDVAQGSVSFTILALNDFHGNLDPPSRVNLADPERPGERMPANAGGAPRLSTLAQKLGVGDPDTIMLAAGDLIGASPLLSSLFHDEPTIESLSMMGLALAAVGNHEFDEGADELRRIQNGGCHPVDGCMGPKPYQGAGFRYLAAGAIDTKTGDTVFPGHAVREFDGVKVGFIGLTLSTTASLIAPFAREGVEFRNEVETIDAETAKLKQQGVEAIVVMIHEGGYPAREGDPCAGMSGPILDIVRGSNKDVDIFITGHSHMAYVCRIDDRLVTSAGRFGTMLTEIDVTLDRASGDVAATTARNVVVRGDELIEDPKQVELISAYRALAEPLMNRHAGALVEPLSNTKTPAGESPTGLLIADAMREQAQLALGQPIDIALMNPGGVRSDFPRGGDVTYNDIFTVQPFGNDIVAMTLTGAEIEAILKQQFRAEDVMILHVSEGSSFRWKRTEKSGELVPGSIVINGAPLDPAKNYRVATNNFLASGGDSFTAFSAARNSELAGGDASSLAAYVRKHAPTPPPRMGRVTVE